MVSADGMVSQVNRLGHRFTKRSKGLADRNSLYDKHKKRFYSLRVSRESLHEEDKLSGS